MADGGVVSVPAMMAIGGAVAGGAMDEENPLRGAALGALGGYTGGAALGAMGGAAGGAAGMGGAAGSGITGATGAAGLGGAGLANAGSAGMMSAAGGGMGGALGGGIGGSTLAQGGLLAGSGLNAAGTSGALLGGAGAGMGGAMGGGISTPMSAMNAGFTAGEIAPSLSMTGHLNKIGTAMQSPEMAQKLGSMGGQMLMNQERQKQGVPVAQTAPPMMRPQFQPAPFMASAPSFRGVTGMPVGRFPMMNRRG